MLDFSHRSGQKELLDAPDIPYADVILNMQELNTVNTLLGGHRITLQGFKKLAGTSGHISVMEIGCGGGDNIGMVKKYGDRNHIEIEMHAIDMNPEICAFARQQNPGLKLQCCDYRSAVIPTKPDIIFSSLFCHHFTAEELVEQIKWMKENSRLGFFINDLHRHPLAYHSIRILTALFSKSYLVKNDAPLSVARSFKKSEWQHIFEEAGIQHYTIRWKWAFRHLIIFEHGK